jgi:tetratricopeptide (TPR) repeat protein
MKYFLFINLIFFLLKSNLSVSFSVYQTIPVSDSVRIYTLIQNSKQLIASDLKGALNDAIEADSLALASTENHFKLMAKMNLGQVFFYKGLYDPALRCYFDMLTIAQEEGNSEWIGKAYYQLGTIRLVMMKYDAALEYFIKAKDILNKYFEDKGGLSINIISGFNNNLGVIYSGLEDYDAAINEFTAGIRLLSDDTLYLTSKIQLMNNLGDTYFKIGDPQSALEQYKTGLQILGENRNSLFEAMLLNGMGRAYLAFENLDEALLSFHKGFSISEKLNGLSHLKHISEGLAETYDLMNKKDSAYIYLQKSKHYNDSLDILSVSEKILKEELISEFNIEKIELSSKIDNIKNSLKKIIFLSIIIFFIISLIYMYQKRRLQTLIQNKQQIVEIASTSKIENKQLKQEVYKHEKMMTLMSMRSIQADALVDLLSKGLLKNGDFLSRSDADSVLKIQKSLKSLQDNNGLKDFEFHFGRLYIGFFEKIQDQFPNLTPNERRLCSFLKLQMNSKEIASVTGQSLRAIEIARTRLRKKIGISNSDIHLNDFFKNY